MIAIWSYFVAKDAELTSFVCSNKSHLFLSHFKVTKGLFPLNSAITIFIVLTIAFSPTTLDLLDSKATHNHTHWIWRQWRQVYNFYNHRRHLLFVVGCTKLPLFTCCCCWRCRSFAVCLQLLMYACDLCTGRRVRRGKQSCHLISQCLWLQTLSIVQARRLYGRQLTPADR